MRAFASARRLLWAARMKHVACLVLLLGACADRSLKSGESPQTSPQGPVGDPVIGCDGSAPFCVDSCGADSFRGQATCTIDGWVCPPPLRRVDECPAKPIDPTARFFFSYAGGVVGSGGGVEILGDGTVHGWGPSGSVTSGPPSYSGKLLTSDVAELFATFHAVDTSALPHANGGAECAVHGGIKDCSTCTEKTFDYSVAKQLLPEMSPVWSWFDAHAVDAISVADFTPAQFCNF